MIPKKLHWLSVLSLLCLAFPALGHAAGERQASYPRTIDWAAAVNGGAGGKVIRVSNLNASGPGSLKAAIDAKGPRSIVFDVGGTIDLDGTALVVRQPDVTITGQSAPSPGITLIRGGIRIASHNVIIQHIRVHVGEAGRGKNSGFEMDGLSTDAAHHVIIDHCTFLWATDENLSASGPRFAGDDVQAWRAGTSHHILFSNNIVAEGLSQSTHSKGEHSKGSLVHDNVSDIVIYGNLFASNVERNPLFKGGAQGVVVNNLIYNPGRRAIHYNLHESQWEGRAYQTGSLSIVGNVLRAGPSTKPGIALMMLAGDGDVAIYMKDNLAVGLSGEVLPVLGRYSRGNAQFVIEDTPLAWPEGLLALPSTQVETRVLDDAGSRPWERDRHEQRLIADVKSGRGAIIDSENDVGGYDLEN